MSNTIITRPKRPDFFHEKTGKCVKYSALRRRALRPVRHCRSPPLTNTRKTALFCSGAVHITLFFTKNLPFGAKPWGNRVQNSAATRKEGNENAQNLSAQKETEKQSPWVQKKNGHRERPQGPGPQTCQGQSQTDPLTEECPQRRLPWALFFMQSKKTAKGYYASADSVTGRHSFFFSVQHAVLQTGAPAAQGGAL